MYLQFIFIMYFPIKCYSATMNSENKQISEKTLRNFHAGTLYSVA